MKPDPLPLPPDNPDRLASFPAVPKDRIPNVLYRIHQMKQQPEFFSTSPERNRWDPPVGSPGLYGTCYTSTSPLGAYAEVLGDLDVITQGMVDRRALSVIEVPAEPRWADMTEPSILGQWGLDVRISVADHKVCQRWGEALFSVGFTGVYYQPRHVIGRGWEASVAIFGDPGHQPTKLRVLDTTPIPLDVVNEATMTFGLEVWPSTPLGPSG